MYSAAALLDLFKAVSSLDSGCISESALKDITEKIRLQLSDESNHTITAYSFEYNARSECCLHILHLFDELLQDVQSNYEQSRDNPQERDNTGNSCRKSIPKPPPQLLSIQQEKAIEVGCTFIFYNNILPCLDAESSRYLKVKILKEKRAFANSIHATSKTGFQHHYLTLQFKILLNLFKNEYIGAKLRTKLLDEYLSTLLFLCFAPTNVRLYSDDVSFFREELEALMERTDRFAILKFILFLKGILSQNHEKSWLKKVSDSLFIRRFLYKENGVTLTIQVGLDICDGAADWRKKEAVASLISALKVPKEEEFFINVSPQIVSLIQRSNIKPQIFEVASLCLMQLLKRNSKLTQDLILKPLFGLLHALVSSDASAENLPDEALCDIVSLLHKIYVQLLPPSADLCLMVEPWICLLATVASFPPTCHVRSSALHILVRYLSQLEPEKCLSDLLIIAELESSEFSPSVREDVALSTSITGIKVEFITEGGSERCLERDENLAKAVVSIIEKLKLPCVALSFYQRLASYVDFSVLNESALPPNLLLVESEKAMLRFTKMRKVLIAVSLLSLITEYEQLIQDIFSDLSQALSFIENLLLIGTQKCQDLELAQTQANLLVNVVMLLVYYLGDRSTKKEISSFEWREMKKLLPTLEVLQLQLKSDSLLPSTSSQAVLALYLSQLRNMILTHGTFTESTHETDTLGTPLDGKSLCKDEKNTPSKKSESSPAKQFSSGNRRSKSSAKNTTVKSSYKEALKDVYSPEIPMRGHGILALSRLLEEKDEETLENADKVFAIFHHHLREEDSYVYLMAIEGLAVICDVLPDKSVPLLSSEVVSGRQKSETRVKLFECFTRAARRLGPFLPKYIGHFINPLLKAMNDEEEAIVISSLSNLGEVCKELKFSLGPLLHEIFAHLYTKIEVTHSAEVRRAAVMVVRLTLRGLGRDALKVLREILPRLYKKLKLLQKSAEDPVLQLHADLAIQEIDSIMQDFFAPKDVPLTKKIFITELPSS